MYLILLVEDEKVLANNYKLILEETGLYYVHVAHSAETALQFCKNVKPDIVLCDIMLDNSTGLQFIKAFKKLGYVDVPFLFLTALTNLDNIREGMILGADDYITKPANGAEIIKRVTIRLARKEELGTQMGIKLKATNNKIKKLNEFMHQWAYSESHLIRGPLTTIMAIVQLIDTSKLDKTSLELFNKIDELCKQIDEVIHNNIALLNENENSL
ncbi:MAG: response regulator transcription factor [Chitinophagaceae bacterium]